MAGVNLTDVSLLMQYSGSGVSAPILYIGKRSDPGDKRFMVVPLPMILTPKYFETISTMLGNCAQLGEDITWPDITGRIPLTLADKPSVVDAIHRLDRIFPAMAEMARLEGAKPLRGLTFPVSWQCTKPRRINYWGAYQVLCTELGEETLASGINLDASLLEGYVKGPSLTRAYVDFQRGNKPEFAHLASDASTGHIMRSIDFTSSRSHLIGCAWPAIERLCSRFDAEGLGLVINDYTMHTILTAES